MIMPHPSGFWLTAVLLAAPYVGAHTGAPGGAAMTGASAPPGGSPRRTAGAQGGEVVDAPALIREVARRESAMQSRRFEYTWTTKVTDRRVNDEGAVTKEVVEVFEVYPIRGEFVRKLVSRNGVAVPPDQAEKELRRAIENLEKADRDDKKRAAASVTRQAPPEIPSFGFTSGFAHRSGFSKGEFHFAPWRFFRAVEFRAPRRERRKGREVIVLDFVPRADFRPANDAQRPYARLAGRVWIDAEDKALMRLEAWPDPASAGTREGKAPPASPADPAVVYEESRLPDGLWIESYVRIRTAGDRDVFNGVAVDMMKEVSDFKRFSAGSGDATLESPRAKP